MYTDTTPPITSPEEVIAGLMGVRDQQRLLDRGLVILAVEWVKHHPAEGLVIPRLGQEGSADDADAVFAELALSGCLSFDDAAVAEFAVAVGITSRTARRLIRESIMLVHLLPRVWARVLGGGLDVWRARALAADCFGLTPAAVEFVDAQASISSARITPSSRETLVARARAQFMPEEERSLEEEARASRCAKVFTREPFHGVVGVEAVLDLPDALALDAALAVGAQALADAGSDAPLEIRRSWALGDLARAATGYGTLFDAVPDPGGVGSPGIGSPGIGSDALRPRDGCSCAVPARGEWIPADAGSSEMGQRPHWNGKGASPPGVKLYLHVSDSAVVPEAQPGQSDSGSAVDPPARVDDGIPAASRVATVEGKGLAGAHVCSPELIREWFTRPTLAGSYAPALAIRPILNLNEERSTGAYRPPERMKEHVRLSHPTCVFPFCNQPAHACDVDHVIPWQSEGAGGATCTCNLAPLCRTHHRLKTHGDNASAEDGEHGVWRYTSLGSGEYFWKGPQGWAFIRNSRGTYDASPAENGGAPIHPGLGQSPDPVRGILGDDNLLANAEDVIRQLLAKATLTRGRGAVREFPLWARPGNPIRLDEPERESPPGSEESSYWDDEGDYIGPTMFFSVPMATPAGASLSMPA